MKYGNNSSDVQPKVQKSVRNILIDIYGIRSVEGEILTVSFVISS